MKNIRATSTDDLNEELDKLNAKENRAKTEQEREEMQDRIADIVIELIKRGGKR